MCLVTDKEFATRKCHGGSVLASERTSTSGRPGCRTLVLRHSVNEKFSLRNHLERFSIRFDEVELACSVCCEHEPVGKVSFRHTAGKGDNAKVIVNARVETTPQHLDELVKKALAGANEGLNSELIAWKYLQPGRPNPTYRFDSVVENPE